MDFGPVPVGMRGDAAWYGQDNVGLELNEWLEKAPKTPQ
jgi:hypothetical protein